MPILFERKVFTSGGSLRVNIPVEITKALEISDGDTLLISLTDHQILMEKAKKTRG
jgi:antitoxin component of MazEF toxin-antitoxin module